MRHLLAVAHIFFNLFVDRSSKEVHRLGMKNGSAFMDCWSVAALMDNQNKTVRSWASAYEETLASAQQNRLAAEQNARTAELYAAEAVSARMELHAIELELEDALEEVGALSSELAATQLQLAACLLRLERAGLLT